MIYIDWTLTAQFLGVFVSLLAVISALYIAWAAKSSNVIAYLDSPEGSIAVDFIVKNIGARPAYDVEIHGFDFDKLTTSDLKQHAEGSFISNGIPLLAPDCQRKTTVAITRELNDQLKEDKIEIKISYRKPIFTWKMKRTEAFVLDFYSFFSTVYLSKENPVVKQLKGIEKNIKEVDKTLNRIGEYLFYEE